MTCNEGDVKSVVDFFHWLIMTPCEYLTIMFGLFVKTMDTGYKPR